MRHLILLTILLALAAGTPGAQNPKPITGQTAIAVQSWVDAVRTHAPGRADAPVMKIAALTYADREELNAGMPFVLAAMLGWGYDTKGNAAAKEIVEIGHGAGNPTAFAFLKQAAVLHADVAAYGDRDADDTARIAAARTNSVEFRAGMGRTTVSPQTAVPPLLYRDRVLLAHDGEVLGDIAASWNWPFARFLLDLLPTGSTEKATPGVEHRVRAADPFVGDWYHATSAYMLAAGTYADLTMHLEHAAKLLPNDPRVLFDRGCYAELFGLPMHQALVDDGNPAMARYRADAPSWAYQEPLLRIPPAERTNAEAERLFRRAAEVDPAFAEARVRLARLLQLRKRHREASDELKRALAGKPDNVTAFYARLFAARSAQALGNSDAAAHYHEALRLFPDAQSALLGASQVALVDADLRGALSAIERLSPRSAEFTADPWWRYHLGPGRDADQLLRALWASVPSGWRPATGR
jgi:tetratricopeptide (TPR) repeat protein